MSDKLPGKRVLIVEDNPVLAFDIDDRFREHGYDVVGPALDLSSGLALARNEALDGAVLDINLCGEFVWPLARELRGHQVPFVFVSAECRDSWPEDFQECGCLDKPTADNILIASVDTMVSGR